MFLKQIACQKIASGIWSAVNRGLLAETWISKSGNLEIDPSCLHLDLVVLCTHPVGVVNFATVKTIFASLLRYMVPTLVLVITWYIHTLIDTCNARCLMHLGIYKHVCMCYLFSVQIGALPTKYVPTWIQVTSRYLTLFLGSSDTSRSMILFPALDVFPSKKHLTTK